MYIAIQDAMVAMHFNGFCQKKLVLVVKRTRAYPWYMARKTGPLRVVFN
jgi:hypothetical protein